jgi:hypothetical protein|tara:strand:+ start:236 stop:598 length:363 start_codon:yes stop_codon:yes gene_type:complete
MYKIRGKITNVETVDINTQKGDFVKKLITIEETDTGFNHVKQFEIFGEESIKTIEHSKKLTQGQYVNITFYIKSREYNGKFYNTLMIKEVRIEDNSTIEKIADDLNKENDKMPFENTAPF